MNNSEIINMVLSKKNTIKTILALPRNKKNAMTTRQLGKILEIPQISMYRIMKQLSKWDNIGQVKITTSKRAELHFYKKSDFVIQFKNGKEKLIILKNRDSVDYNSYFGKGDYF